MWQLLFAGLTMICYKKENERKSRLDGRKEK